MNLRVRASASGATGAFFVSAALFLLLGAAILLLAGRDNWNPAAPAFIAAVHAILLGGLGSIYFGASHQLYPVVSEQQVTVSGWGAWSHCWLHQMGVGAMVAGFWGHWYMAVAVGGMGVLGGTLILSVRAGIALEKRRAWNPESVGFFLALSWMLVAMVLGLSMTLVRLGLLPAALPFEAVRGFHLRMAMGGFFLNLLFGLSHRLVPMFLVSRNRGSGWARSSLVLLNSGLLLGGIGLMGPQATSLALGDLLLALSAVPFALATGFQVRSRMRPLGGSFISYLLGVAGLTLCAAWAAADAGALLVSRTLPWGVTPAWIPLMLLPPLALLPIVFGVSARIIPFLAWQSVCAPFLGQRKLPQVQALWSERLLWVESLLIAGSWLLCLVAMRFLDQGLWAWVALSFALPLIVRGWNCAKLVRNLRSFQRETALSI